MASNRNERSYCKLSKLNVGDTVVIPNTNLGVMRIKRKNSTLITLIAAHTNGTEIELVPDTEVIIYGHKQ